MKRDPLKGLNQPMGSSPSREMQQENGEEAQPPGWNAPETSMMPFQETESTIQRVKRKRKRSSNEGPRRKWQKSSPPTTLERLNESTAASQDEQDGTQSGTPHVATNIPPTSSNGMLTPISKKNRKTRMRTVVPARAAEDPDEDSTHREPESEADEPNLPEDNQPDLTCNICGRQFGKRKHLIRHMRNLKLHQKGHKCNECDKAFYRREELKTHQSDTGHSRATSQSGNSRGAFTEKERAKLSRFKRRFCNDHSVSEFDFNTLMTLLGRRDGSEWPNPDVTRSELRGMFYDVLPDRGRKSMNRYRERYFQNVEQDTEWTGEQIKELKDLVKEKGRKWVEIGERLGRTQDSVYQKWKNRIRQGDAQRFERWEEDEREALILAVRECKIAAGAALDFSSDDKVNWTAVSDRLGKRRNAQQCSTFWKRVYRPREEAKARGQDLKPLPSGHSKLESTKSRHQTRRRVTRGDDSVEVITPRRRIKSAMYVAESDDDNNAPVGNALLRDGRESTKPEVASTVSDEGDVSERGANGIQSEEVGEQEESDEDEDMDEDDNEGDIDSPSKKPRRDKLIEVMIPPSSLSRHHPESQTAPAAILNGTFQAVNRHHRQSDQSLRHNETKPSATSDSGALRSSQTHETPRLPPLTKRTPRHITSLSQAFNNTQAPTSARTAGRTTPSKLPVEERPSPDIEIQLRPLQGEESPTLAPNEANEDETEQPEIAEPQGADFAIYESEAEDSNDGQPTEGFRSPSPLQKENALAEPGSEVDTDSEAHDSDDEQPPQMFSSAAPEDANQSPAAEAGLASDDQAVQDNAVSEAEETSEDDASPPPVFSSAAAAPDTQNDLDVNMTESGSEVSDDDDDDDDDDDEPPQIFRSAAIAVPVPAPIPKQENQPRNPDAATDASETEEVENNTEDEEEDEEEEPPQIFTSALPTDAAAAPSEASPSSSSSSSGDAATIRPNGSESGSGSQSGDSDSGDGSGEEKEEVAADNDGGGGSGGNSDHAMVEEAQADFFANLEASARKARLRRVGGRIQSEVGERRDGVGVGGRGGRGDVDLEIDGGAMRGERGKSRQRKRKREVFDVSSSSGEES